MNLWRGLVQVSKDYLFPIFCLECKVEGQWWCENCLKKYTVMGVYYCPICHVSNSNGQPCGRCKAVSLLNSVTAFLDYNDEAVIGQLIRQFKYNFAFDIVSVWEKMIDLFLLDIIKKMDISAECFTIIPVPLHIKRERERGFNQANLVAQLIFKKLDTERLVGFDNKSFQRKKYTQQQAKLNRVDRLNNLKEAFVWSGKESAPKNILLVDDVYTSGTTMQECATVLKKFGTQKVYGFTLARD
ncbi:MAG: ComF family protein [Candidatus Magasanikbacteria bacterium]